MGFHFCEAYEEVTGEGRSRQIQGMQMGGGARKLNPRHFVEVQVREKIFKTRDGLKITGGLGEIERIAPKARATGAIRSISPRPSVLRRWPGPSAMRTSAAPSA